MGCFAMYGALLLTTAAGLFTALGGILAVIKKPTQKAIAFSMGFAAGIMVTISLGDMLPKAAEYYQSAFSKSMTVLVVASLLFMGMAIAGLLERCVPEQLAIAQMQQTQNQNLVHSAVVMAAALVLHNLPEGILTLFAGISNPDMGVRLAIAVALHNIPEGMIVAAPLYYATNRRKKAVMLALFSGLSEPVGAVLAFLFVGKFLTPGFLNGLMVLVSGVMLWISVAELIPTAYNMDKSKTTIVGVGTGVLLLLLGIKLLS